MINQKKQNNPTGPFSSCNNQDIIDQPNREKMQPKRLQSSMYDSLLTDDISNQQANTKILKNGNTFIVEETDINNNQIGKIEFADKRRYPAIHHKNGELTISLDNQSTGKFRIIQESKQANKFVYHGTITYQDKSKFTGLVDNNGKIYHGTLSINTKTLSGEFDQSGQLYNGFELDSSINGKKTYVNGNIEYDIVQNKDKKIEGKLKYRNAEFEGEFDQDMKMHNGTMTIVNNDNTLKYKFVNGVASQDVSQLEEKEQQYYTYKMQKMETIKSKNIFEYDFDNQKNTISLNNLIELNEVSCYENGATYTIVGDYNTSCALYTNHTQSDANEKLQIIKNPRFKGGDIVKCDKSRLKINYSSMINIDIDLSISGDKVSITYLDENNQEYRSFNIECKWTNKDCEFKMLLKEKNTETPFSYSILNDKHKARFINHLKNNGIDILLQALKPSWMDRINQKENAGFKHMSKVFKESNEEMDEVIDEVIDEEVKKKTKKENGNLKAQELSIYNGWENSVNSTHLADDLSKNDI